MQVSVEAPSKLERRLTVIVPVEKMNEAFDKHLAKVAKNAKIAGFRPGKAPMNVIKQRYGDTARQEALSDVIQSSLYAALNQEKLNPVDAPVVEPKVVMADQPLEFIATFEVLPEMEGFHFDVKSLEKQIATISNEDIERVLERLRMQHVQWKKVDRAAAEKDQVAIDFRGSLDGVPFAGGEAHDYPIVLGSKSMIPGFEEGIIGMQPGDAKEIDVTFPEKYHAAEMAGKTVQFALKAISVSEPVLPEMNETFVKKLGIKSGDVADLHAEIRRNLQRELDRVVSGKLKSQVFDKLIEQNPVDLPKALIEREANRIHDEVHPHHDGHAHSHTDAEMLQFHDAAKRNVTLGLLINQIVKQHKIVTDKDRLQEHLAQLVASYENPAEVLSWYSKNKRALAEVEMQILEEQVLETLLKDVQVTEKMLSYNELMSH